MSGAGLHYDSLRGTASAPTKAELIEAVDACAAKVDEQQATIQRLAAALKRCDSEAVWDDLVDMWLVPTEVMDEIRAALREAGVEDG